MSSFIHTAAICESSNIGTDTRIWAFAHILKGAVIGNDCNICDHVFIENDVKIGNRVTIKCGVQIWDGIEIQDDVFIGPNASFTNDDFPRSKKYRTQPLRTFIHKGASIGANATILPGIEIGREAMIGAGAVVTGNVPPFAVVTGNPGRIVGYSDQEGVVSKESVLFDTDLLGKEIPNLGVKGVLLKRLNRVYDLRGSLCVGNFPDEIPFTPKRYFMVFDVPSTNVRGEHAHLKCQQFCVCVRGSVSLVLDDGKNRKEINLSQPELGVYIPPLIWNTQYKFSSDAILLVFASHTYDSNDYIRKYEEFLSKVKN